MKLVSVPNFYQRFRKAVADNAHGVILTIRMLNHRLIVLPDRNRFSAGIAFSECAGFHSERSSGLNKSSLDHWIKLFTHIGFLIAGVDAAMMEAAGTADNSRSGMRGVA